MEWARAAILGAALMLSGCATVMDGAKSTDVFAACKAADVVTTVVGISSGAFPEANPLMAKVLAHGYLPFIAISYALWYVVDRINNPSLTIGANAITCPIAAHNLWLIMR